MLRALLARSKAGTLHLNYGREIIVRWGVEYAQIAAGETLRVLDVGCHRGTGLLNLQRSLPDRRLELFGVECREANADVARQRGIQVWRIDVERETIPARDEFFDIVIANQVIEHTKEIFWVLSEISRTLKRGGRLIVGVPNLASLHNRVLLLLGEHPTSIEPLGPHVRGFTAPAFKRLIEADGHFKLLEARGSNLYPFPPSVSKSLSRLFPTLSVVLYFLIRREDKTGNFINVLDTRSYETPYFRGAYPRLGHDSWAAPGRLRTRPKPRTL
jgi:2-polyprenyl-3-methyl-5-hydroxy-6-metoxy-1,4-benzoquinol methylase